MMVVAALLSVLSLLSLLALGLIWMTIRHGGSIVIESKTVATLFKQILRIEYRPQDRSSPATGNVVENPPSAGNSIEPSSDASAPGAEPRIGGDQMT
jgi:beta-lactam-binding protein with PASTA domain